MESIGEKESSLGKTMVEYIKLPWETFDESSNSDSLVVRQWLSQNRLSWSLFINAFAPPCPSWAMVYPLQSKAWDANNIEVELTHQIRSGTIHHPQTGTKPLMKSSRRVLGSYLFFAEDAKWFWFADAASPWCAPNSILDQQQPAIPACFSNEPKEEVTQDDLATGAFFLFSWVQCSLFFRCAILLHVWPCYWIKAEAGLLDIFIDEIKKLKSLKYVLHKLFWLCILAENWSDDVLCKITTEFSRIFELTFHRMYNGSLCSTCSYTIRIVSLQTGSMPGTPNRADDSICPPLRRTLNHGTHWPGNLGRTNWFPAWCPVPFWRRKCNQDDRKD